MKRCNRLCWVILVYVLALTAGGKAQNASSTQVDVTPESRFDGGGPMPIQLTKAVHSESCVFTNLKGSMIIESSHQTARQVLHCDIRVEDAVAYSVLRFRNISLYSPTISTQQASVQIIFEDVEFISNVQLTTPMNILILRSSVAAQNWKFSGFDATARLDFIDLLQNANIAFNNSNITFSKISLIGVSITLLNSELKINDLYAQASQLILENIAQVNIFNSSWEDSSLLATGSHPNSHSTFQLDSSTASETFFKIASIDTVIINNLEFRMLSVRKVRPYRYIEIFNVTTVFVTELMAAPVADEMYERTEPVIFVAQSSSVVLLNSTFREITNCKPDLISLPPLKVTD